jgi:hypothetical protein
MDGVMNLLSLAALNFLGNVLDFRTYSAPNQGEDEVASDEQKTLLRNYDRCNITGDERSAMCYARGVAVVIFDWIRKHATITVESTIHEDFPSLYVCHLLKALIEYKTNAMEKQLTGAPHCSLADFLKQVENVIQSDKQLLKAWKEWDNLDSSIRCSLLRLPTDQFSVYWSADAFTGLQGEILLFFSLSFLLIILSS